METWTNPKVTRGMGWGEGTRQRTCMNDPQAWTTVCELTVGAGVGMGGGGQREKN